MTYFFTKARKCVIAGFGAGFAAFLKGHSSQADWIFIVGSTAVVGFAAWWIPNTP
jgi:hypothetical protein